MKKRIRTYHDVDGDDRSQLLEQVGAQRARVRERLGEVRRVVAVMSGKGGVGKSHVTAGMARAAAERLDVGVLDADLEGPTVARLLDARGPVRLTPDAAEPVLGARGVRVFSMEFLLEDGEPLRWKDPGADRFLWRGTLAAGAIREFLSDVAWGPLDLLLLDLPPGAGQVADLADLVPDLAGAVAVTLPSAESYRSVRRAVRAAEDAGVRLLGMVENMSGYACDGCGETRPLFPGDAGARLAADFDVPLLARIPFTPPPAAAVPPGVGDLVARLLEILS